MKADRELLGMLRDVPLFEEMSDRELNAIANRGRIVDHKPGHEVVQEGGGAVGFHLILEGKASVLRHNEVRGRLGPGNYFGEISLLDGKPRSATIRADEPVQTFAILAWEFSPLLDEHPQLSRKLLLGLCAHLRAAESVAN